MNALEEKDAIRDVLAEFCTCLYGGRFDEMAALFTEDGTWEAPFGKPTGRQAISQAAATGRRAQPGSRDIHLLSNIVIALDGDRANVHSNWVVVQNGPQGPQIRRGGVSADEMVKQAGKWLFHYRKTDPHAAVGLKFRLPGAADLAVRHPIEWTVTGWRDRSRRFSECRKRGMKTGSGGQA